MCQSYLMLNGKRIDLTPEQLATLGIETPKKSPFERQKAGNDYYFITDDGHIYPAIEGETEDDDDLFAVANYCTDESIMEQRALHEILNRRLWRYSMEHDGDKIKWADRRFKYSIYMSHFENKACTCGTAIAGQVIGAPYFFTLAAAEAAIEEIVKPFMEEHPEFKL